MNHTKDKLPHTDVTKLHGSESEIVKFGQRITQNEVEEQLKAMKQRRLSRMNILEDEKSIDKTVNTCSSFKSAAKIVMNNNKICETENSDIRSTCESDKLQKLGTSEGVINHKTIQSSNNNVFAYLPSSDSSSKKQQLQVPSAELVTKNNNLTDPNEGKQRRTIYYKDNEAIPQDLVCSTEKAKQYISDTRNSPKNIRLGKEDNLSVNKKLPVVSTGKHEIDSRLSKAPTFHPKTSSSPGHGNSERILKKFQLNWNNLNDILENSSDVDLDEMNDLMNSMEEASSLIGEYREKLESLEQKLAHEMSGRRKLNRMKCQVEQLKPQIKYFRGLRKDSGYLQLSNKLSNIFLEIHKVPDSYKLSSEKEEVISEVNSSIKDLEARVKKNQTFLEFILNEQVLCIRDNHYKSSK
ncbi:unnamed protein product [Phaedon cochleariae]|uniref:Uncharacterized protein n=1 Tax=Phaedon cochleariae TaxID=80249 RepID=A0A9N9SHR9_PHACE|nr:unnamed protein product [Phaedon cochleariae]